MKPDTATEPSRDAAATDTEASASFWSDHNLTSPTDVRYWLAVKEVREAVNSRLTGDPDLLFIESFLRSLQDRWPLPRALSIGCGTGELERGVLGLGAVAACHGIDVSADSIEMARDAARHEPDGGSLSYFVSDASSWLGPGAEKRDYDIVFFHGSLHHIQELETVLEGSAEALRERSGWLYVDEYVGPSRDEWDEEDLGFAAGLFRAVPEEDRRTPRVWPPIAIEDPTEMIRSSEIRAVIRRYFTVEDERPYYGNVLMPLVNAIRGTSLGKPAIKELVRKAIGAEDHLATSGLLETLYCALIARPRPRQ